MQKRREVFLYCNLLGMSLYFFESVSPFSRTTYVSGMDLLTNSFKSSRQPTPGDRVVKDKVNSYLAFLYLFQGGTLKLIFETHFVVYLSLPLIELINKTILSFLSDHL